MREKKYKNKLKLKIFKNKNFKTIKSRKISKFLSQKLKKASKQNEKY